MRFYWLLMGLIGCSSFESATLAHQSEVAPRSGTEARTFVDEHGVRVNCAATEYRSVDFMIGDWDAVETKSGKHFLFNRVQPLNGGCAFSETLMMRDDLPGFSLNFYSASDKRWHSFYHSPTLYAAFEGAMDAAGNHVMETRIILPGGKQSTLVRQITSRDSRGRPRQVGLAIGADGTTNELWDLTFCSLASGADRSAPCNEIRSK